MKNYWLDRIKEREEKKQEANQIHLTGKRLLLQKIQQLYRKRKGKGP